ncbi:RrF2 family transcriptional regulator [Patescibacteria group bacterium]|nr:RrF2 family transcriptional regulator [Patescibacteria group bacterium]
MKISKKSQYGLRAMVYLANPRLKDKACPLKKISKDEEIPFDFLEKIFSKLEKAGLIKAKRGIQGGYFLAREPKKITVGKIIRILEGTIAPVRCIAKEKGIKFHCPRKKICKTFNVWQKIQDILNSTLNSITLADLVKPHRKAKLPTG